jgi:hypothetical protein
MHTSHPSRFLAVFAFARHQSSGHPLTTRRSVLNTRLRVDLTRGSGSPTRRQVRPHPLCSTSSHLLHRSSGSLSGSWARASLTTLPLLVFGHFTMLFSLFLLYVMLLCLFSATCSVNPIRLGFRLCLSEVVFFFFFFGFLFGNLFSSVNIWHLNLHGFSGSLFRCHFGVCLELPMVVSIRLRRGKGSPGLHSQTSTIFTGLKEYVVCLDWVYMSMFYCFLCLSCTGSS